MNIYVLSGLGADERIFQRLNFGNFTPVFLPWITPVKGESLESYAWRMSAQISEAKPVLLGVSFGGMLVVEISKKVDCQKVILISTAVVESEIPALYRMGGRLGIQRFIPDVILKRGNFFVYWLFGMTTTTEKDLLKNILRDTNSIFLRWAMYAITHWRNKDIPRNCIRVHGDCDRILPLKKMQKIDHLIHKGGHLLVFTHADHINDIIK